ncbi:TRAT1 protein, partial [Rhinopomastus cyanomelas]|nr:TRAT1 protein [Rhinopomastus cyanomelas]
TEMSCHLAVWVVLAVLSLALVVSLVLNILHCMRKKQACSVSSKQLFHSPSSCDDYYTEDDPVYGNLSQDPLEECCYEQMKIQPQRPVNQLQVESASQMCYASLDHSIKGNRRKPRRKNNHALEKGEAERSPNHSTTASRASIYLNSEQLAAENTAKEEAIHDDPIRLMGLIHATKGEN